jgi:signal transduction histidine kinase
MGKTIGYYLLVLPLIFLVFGCKNSSKGNGQCTPALTDQSKKLPSSGSIEDLHSVMHFYDTTNAGCHDAIAQGVIENIFMVLYTHQQFDTVVVPYLNKISLEEGLSVQHRSRALMRIASYYLLGLENAKPAMPYMERADVLLPQMGDSVKKIYYGLKAKMAVEQSNLNEATTYYLKGIAICEKLKDSVALFGSLSNFSIVYSRMGDYNKAAEMKKRSADYFLRRKDYNNVIYAYIGIGTEYGLMRNYDSASRYNLLVIDLIESKTVFNPDMAFLVYCNMAGIELGLSDKEKARYYYGKAKEQLPLIKNPDRNQFFLMASSPVYAEVRKMDTEITAINTYIPDYMKNKDYHRASDAYYALFLINFTQAKYHPAISNYIHYDSLKSLISDQDNKKYVAEMETKYNTQKKQLQIEGQQKEIKKQKAIMASLAVMLLAVILIIALFSMGLKMRRHRREALMQQEFTKKLLEQTEDERIRIARDLHDGVSQELMILKNQIPQEQGAHREKIDGIINEIRAISRDLHPVMLEKIGLKASVEHICEQMMENNYIFISSEIDYTKSLNKAGELQMFRMIQEALNNIIKYAKAEAAKVTISESDKYVLAEIIDNGEGFDVEEAMNSKASFGLMNLKERSKAMNGKTIITSTQAGTIIKIEIPKSNV